MTKFEIGVVLAIVAFLVGIYCVMLKAQIEHHRDRAYNECVRATGEPVTCWEIHYK